MDNFLSQEIEQASQSILRGECVIFPTETVYGLGARADKSDAVRKIFRLKGRPLNNPLIIHVPNIDEVFKWTKGNSIQNDIVLKLGAHFWPGPMTIVLPAGPNLAPEVTAGLSTVGIRIPNHPIALDLLKNINVPLAAPSANQSGHISATSHEDAFFEFSQEDVLILKGGNCEVGLESTIVSVSETGNVAILRRGAISEEEIKKISRGKACSDEN